MITLGSWCHERILFPAQICNSDAEYQDEVDPMENGGFSNWHVGHSQRGDGNMVRAQDTPVSARFDLPGQSRTINLSVFYWKGPRRGAPYRPNNGPHRRNSRFGNRLGPMRRQNNRNNQAGNSGHPKQPSATVLDTQMNYLAPHEETKNRADRWKCENSREEKNVLSDVCFFLFIRMLNDIIPSFLFACCCSWDLIKTQSK